MISETLSVWGNGAVTLPKEWRDQYQTKHYMAESTPEGFLVIKPILRQHKGRKGQEVIYYEEADGTVGLHFPYGMDLNEFIRRWDRAEKKISRMERPSTSRRPRKRG